MAPTPREAAAVALTHACAEQVRESIAALKRDVALSFRICGRDFGVLGRELVNALDAKQLRERAAVAALEHERLARRRAHAKAVEAYGHVRVRCRVRPLLPTELTDAGETVTLAPPHDIHVRRDSATSKNFSFDRVYGEEVTQHHVFKDVLPLVHAAVDGQHACVFAYGQTGAGKTHTIHGSDSDRGVTCRAAETLFDLVREQQQHFDFNVAVQMVEVYNEELYDLLGAEVDRENSSLSTSSSSSNNNSSSAGVVTPFHTNASSPQHSPPFVSKRPVGEIRHGERGVYLRNVESVPVHSAQELMAAISDGELNRTVQGSGASDDHSSRSHCVVMIEIQRCSHVDGQIDTGRFVLVELAGSERLIRSELAGPKLREAQHINRSLAAVGDVLSAVLNKEKHVPFRNSKLTHLLQESLGAADGQTLMLVHVSPTLADVNETVNTLKFAARISRSHSGSGKISERQELSRLHGMISSQAAQLQALQDKLAGELELRRKYEKRLEEYRQEDHRRRAKEDNRVSPPKPPTGLSTPPPKAMGPFAPPQPPTTTTATPSRRHITLPDQPYATQRWNLYAKKESFKANGGGLATGQENISENILRSRIRSPNVHKLPTVLEKPSQPVSTPARRHRRLSVMAQGSERKAMRSPLRVAPLSGVKRRAPPASEVRSILKRQRLSIEPRAPEASETGGPKQVSFDLPSTRLHSGDGETLAPLPPRQPPSLLRTPMNATRVPATRVRTPSSFASSPASRVRSPMRSNWHGGWRS